MNTYFQDLQHDLRQAYPGHGAYLVEELGDLQSQLQYTLDRPSHKGFREVAPRTSLGKHLRMVAEIAIGYSPNGSEHYVCCDEAEPKLLASLSPNICNSADTRAPLILTYGGQPVGIRKQLGEASTFGLRSVPEIGLIANSFAASTGVPNPRLLDTITGAYSYELTAKNSFRFLRSSVFDVPVTARRTLTHPDMSTGQIELLEGSIVHLRTRVKALLRTARPLHR